MNHRQRVLTALCHQEPDRVPIDLGGTVDSTIVFSHISGKLPSRCHWAAIL